MALGGIAGFAGNKLMGGHGGGLASAGAGALLAQGGKMAFDMFKKNNHSSGHGHGGHGQGGYGQYGGSSPYGNNGAGPYGAPPPPHGGHHGGGGGGLGSFFGKRDI